MFNVFNLFFLSLIYAFPLDLHSGVLTLPLKHVNDIYYSATLEIGGSSQKVELVVDSGSADTWVMASSNPFCSANANKNGTYHGRSIKGTINCEDLSTVDVNSSKGLVDLNIGRFYINYTDGSFADGYWAKDEVRAAGSHINELQLGVAEYATAQIPGLLGIGFPRRESVRGYSGAPNEFYDNFPQMLKKDGIIDTVAYSMYLNDPQLKSSSSGSIMFGAVDPSKYSGHLYTFPMANQYPDIVSKPATLAVTLQGFGAQNAKDNRHETFSTNKYAVLLDSGTSLMGAPEPIVAKMAHFINKDARFSEEDGVYVMDCPSDDDNTEFIFDFGDLQIAVPLSTLILPPTEGITYCGLGVVPKKDTWTLGDVFLSYAYVVFDLDNYKISMAKAKFNPIGEQLPFIKIPSDGNIPGAKTATATPWTSPEPLTVNGSIFTRTSDVSAPYSTHRLFPWIAKNVSKTINIVKQTSEAHTSQLIPSAGFTYTQVLTESVYITVTPTPTACGMN